MYPNLRYAVYDVLGIDIQALALVQSYGFFLAVAFLISGFILTRELKRREKEGLLQSTLRKVSVGQPFKPSDLALNVILGFVLGFKGGYLFLNPEALQTQEASDVLFSGQGNFLLGILFAGLFGYLKYQERQKELKKYPKPKTLEVTVLPHQRVSDIIIVAAVSGIAGAKILYLLEYPAEFYQDPVAALFSGSGLTVYGGMILAFVCVTWYARKHKIAFRQLADAVAPVMFVGYGIGRLGCHFAGDGDWGDPNPFARPDWLSWLPDWLWAYRYPHNVINSGEAIPGCDMEFWSGHCTQLAEAVYPTPVYEFFMSMLLVGLLWSLRKRLQHIPGLLFFVYVILNGLERFTIEIIRINDEYALLGIDMTQAQAIAILLSLVGCIGAAYILWEHKSKKA